MTLLLLHSLCVGIVQLFTARAAEPLFLVSFGAHNLPYLYIGSAVATTVVGVLYARFTEGIDFPTMLVVALGASLLGTCILRLLLWLPDARWPTMVLGIWASVQYVLINLEFWGLAGRLFDVRQSKRLFGLIGSAEVIATIGCGLLTPALVWLVGTPNLLWIAAGGLAGALLCLISLVRERADALTVPAEGDKEVASTGTYRGLLKDRYVVLMIALTSLSWLGWYVVDNMFYNQVASRYAGEDQLASFLGVFGAIAGCLTLVSRTVATGPIITRNGLLVGLLACPVLVAASAALLAVSGTVLGAGLLVYGLALLTKLTSDVLEASIYHSSFLVLYQPLAPTQRVHLQTMVATLVEPVAVACAGVVLLVLINRLGFGAVQLAYVAVAVFLVMSAVGVVLGRAYPAALLRALDKRKLGGRTLTPTDRSTVAVLQEGLRSPHVGVVIYSLDLLESIQHPSLAASLQNLLTHPVPEIREDVLLRIERLGLSVALPSVRQRVVLETSAPVRGTAVRALVALGEREVVDEAAAFLSDADPSIKLGAMIGLLRSGGIEGVLLAGTKLIELAQATAPDDRVLAARALGDAGIPSSYRPLMPLLQDGVPRVRAAALEAAGKLKHPRLWPLVVTGLAEPAVRTAAAAALVAGGDAVVPELRAIFTQPVQPKQVLIRTARICGRIRGPAAIALLEEHVAFADTDVRGQVLAALNRSGYHVQGDRVPRIRKQITAEVADVAGNIATLVDIGDGPEVELLRAALNYQLQQSRERILVLLSFIYDSQAILRARDNLVHVSGAQRAYALEVLELMVAHELKPSLLAVFDDLQPTERLQRLSAAYPQTKLDRAARLCDLIGTRTARHPWIQACALYALMCVSSRALEEAIASALAAPDALVRETAEWVEWKRAPPADKRPNPVTEDASHTHGGAWGRRGTAGERMTLSTIEKVLILKSVGIFADTPHEVLLDLTAVLEEVDIPTGHTIFAKGDLGTCMYIIVDGRVRVHDGERTLDELGAGDVFGEMAVLDAAPRMASATALDATRLFRLDQDSLYEVMADRIEVVRGIIGVLSGRLRARAHDVEELSARVQDLTNQSRSTATS